MNLLHIDSSVLGDNSVSRRVSSAVVERLAGSNPDLDIVYRDLAAKPLPHLSGSHLAAVRGAGVTETPARPEDVALAQAVLGEFLAADIVVIGAPMYNFTIPSQLKSWVDRILVAGKTFRYGAQGPEGLAGGKRVIIAISRGGFYGAAPAAAAEHVESYLRALFGFMGVTDLEFIVAEGVQTGPEQREKAVAGALQAAAGLSAPAELVGATN